MVEYKQVILVRQDLGLPKGKLAAQCAHASVEAVLKSDPVLVKAWRNQGMKKVVLKVKDERDLYHYAQAAKDDGLITGIITDAGKTVVAPGTVTCCGIGPADEKIVDMVVGSLGLF